MAKHAPPLEKYSSIYQVAFENMNQGFCLLEKVDTPAGKPPDFRYLLTNQAFTHQSGLEQVVGKTLQQVVPLVEDHILAHYQEVALRGIPIHFESYVATLNRWIDTYAFRIDAQAPVQIAVLFTDITARKQVQRALHESEERLRLFVATSSDIVYRMSADWQQMEQLVGKEFQVNTPTTNQTWLEQYIPPQDQPSVKALIQAAIRTKSLFELEHRVIQADGRLGWTFSRAIPVLSEQGIIQEWFGAASNTTARKQAEEALQQTNQRKDEFLAMLAHELRNPMSTIRSGLQLLRLNGGTDESSRATLALMDRQADQLVRLVDDLLDVSRISQDKIALKTQRVNLVEVVAQAAESVQVLYQEQGRRLAIHLPTAPIYVEGDEVRLSQIVTNLLTNGARYTGESGQVWLRVAQQNAWNASTQNCALPTDQQEALIQVRDDGIGLAADQLEAIFELFMQVDNSLARSKGGLGLGLTLVKRLVELHGGWVEAQSEGVGKGSTFQIHLPTVNLAPEQTFTPAEGSLDSCISAETPTQQILVIDDNADAALTLSMLLNLSGYAVHTRYSGQAGLEAVAELKPKVVLLDIGMPGMDGYQTAQAIRQCPGGGAVILIALTGYGGEEDRQRVREAGFDQHLVKPVELQPLLASLTGLLATSER